MDAIEVKLSLNMIHMNHKFTSDDLKFALVIVDEPVPQQYDLVYDAPEVITPTNRATNYARYNPGIFPWTSFRQRIGLSDLAKMKLVGPKRGTSGIRLI